MADSPAAPAPAEAPPIPVVITFTFTGPNSVDFKVDLGTASTGQLYLLAWFVDQLAREVRQGDLTRQAMKGLTVSPASILDQLRQSGRA